MRLTSNGFAIESYDSQEHPKLSSMYEDDELLVEYVASGRVVAMDYGVPGSPVWHEIDDIEIDTFNINGVDYTEKKLVEKLGKDAVDELYEICAKSAEGRDWER